ncbi:LOW QUALITY PROTEIN: uncharacterized protein LOC131852194 [Achroia grisella]|uniref:LOW QUALITY PROTEIN: uncharacterized protein LOC131852194 n=1 Tax=Achroia grisella TaxID=688607 RepID=UPI0027D2355D|nr:LOW QUALITY PROTEIN: uncharacterized protein LOC131852194 [Achroia grisella]
MHSREDNLYRMQERIIVEYLDRIIGFKSCNQEVCPMIRERLDEHREEHHKMKTISKSSNTHRRESLYDMSSQTVEGRSKGFHIAVLNTTSNIPRSRNSVHNQVSTFKNINRKTHNNVGTDVSNNTATNTPIRQTDTWDVIAPRNNYKDALKSVIMKWLQEIPIYPNFDPSTKEMRDNMVNNLLNKIYSQSVDVNCETYDEKIKRNINIFLNNLPMWHPGAKRDQELFVKGLTENLLEKIKYLNNESLNKVSDHFNNNHNNSNGVHKKDYLNIRRSNDVCIDKNDHFIIAEIDDWLLKIKFNKSNKHEVTTNRNRIKHLLITRLTPLLKGTITCENKLILQAEIIKVLQELPISVNCAHNKKSLCNKYAQDLTDRLVSLQLDDINYNHYDINKTISQDQVSNNNSIFKYGDDIKRMIIGKVRSVLQNNEIDSFDNIEDRISNVLIDNLHSLNSTKDSYAKDEICNILRNCRDIPELQASNIAVSLVNKAKRAAEVLCNTTLPTGSLKEPSRSRSVFILTSEHEISPLSNYPVTSTPKQNAKVKEEISKLNNEEIKYMGKVLEVIKSWMNTLPVQFNNPEDKNFKETIINDLAGDITDEVKLEQIAPHTNTDRDLIIKYLILRWLFKFDIFGDVNVSESYLDDFLTRLSEITVPDMTKPQHGNRQAMDNIKHMHGELARKELFVPKGIDILEDEISIWMNEQSSDIYLKENRDHRNKIVHELAQTLRIKLNNKQSETEIKADIAKWLNNIIVPEEKRNIDILTSQLNERVMKLPQDTTLANNLHKKIEQEGVIIQPTITTKTDGNTDVRDTPIYSEDVDKTLMQLINKFIEHNFDSEDNMAKGAFCQLLKLEFRNLSPPTRQEVYENFAKSRTCQNYPLKRLNKELQYIKIISDWLKNIPIDYSYNRPGNKKRVEFVTNLAKNICDVEMDRTESSEAMDYNIYLASIISQFMDQLPFLPEHVGNIKLIIDQLICKVVEIQSPLSCCQDINQEGSCNDDSIEEQNLEDFIEQYIYINSKDFADDQVKLDAWTNRVLKEVKNIIHNSTDPAMLCKSDIYNKLSAIPTSEDKIVNNFGKELTYAKEVSDWLNNFSLLPIKNSNDKDLRINMISDLAKKISEIDEKKVGNDEQVSDNSAELENLVTKWISKLPVNNRKKFSMPVAVQQLIRRINRVDSNKQASHDELKMNNDNSNNNNTNKSTKSKSHNKMSKHALNCNKVLKSKNPGDLILELIENWCRGLPIEGATKDKVNEFKDDIAKKLYQRVGDLNLDPRLCNDNELYQDVLDDEIDTILENLPRTTVLMNNWDKLKITLIQNIVEARKMIKSKYSGEYYKQQLDNTIETSIPIPLQNNQYQDPGFEIYKKHLASMFILENFDCGNDTEKLKYENKIKDEVDKYFLEAQKRNAVPISRDNLYNELYSALYKVPIPDENSVIEQVEEIKTKCEIEDWFNNLPMKEVASFDELLQWDKILSLLAKRIHEIETNESTPDIKIQKEISKWLSRLPIISEQSVNVEKYAEQLCTTLRATKNSRKCDRNKNNSSSKSHKERKKSKNKGILDTSQIAGPSSASRVCRTMTSSTQQPCCQSLPAPQKKAADLILAIVENWCADLPLFVNNKQENIDVNEIKNDLVTKIIIIISKLNADPTTFRNEILFNHFFDDELENALATIPTCCVFQQSKEARKSKLKEVLNSVKPLMKTERELYEYKEELKHTISIMLEQPENIDANKIALLNDIREDILNNFIQYSYNKDDIEDRQVFKFKVHDALLKYLQDVADNKGTEQTIDPLIQRNRLLCELSKIPIPSEEIIREEVLEIKMKKEVENFFNDSLPNKLEDKKLTKQVESSLAKRLHDIEKRGHNCANDSTMKEEIVRSIKKLGIEIKAKEIDAFVNKLKDNEMDRKTSPIRKPDTSDRVINTNQLLRRHGYSSYENRIGAFGNYDPAVLSSNGQIFPYIPVNLPQYSEQWLTLDSTTANPNILDMSNKQVNKITNEQNIQLSPHINVFRPYSTEQVYIPTPTMQTSKGEFQGNQTLNASPRPTSVVANQNPIPRINTTDPIQNIFVYGQNSTPIVNGSGKDLRTTNSIHGVQFPRGMATTAQNTTLSLQNRVGIQENQNQNSQDRSQILQSRPLAAAPGFTPQSKKRKTENYVKENHSCNCIASRKNRRKCMFSNCLNFGPICWMPYPRPDFFYY